jgi:hypothetical protein
MFIALSFKCAWDVDWEEENNNNNNKKKREKKKRTFLIKKIANFSYIF